MIELAMAIVAILALLEMVALFGPSSCGARELGGFAYKGSPAFENYSMIVFIREARDCITHRWAAVDESQRLAFMLFVTARARGGI